MVNKILLMSLNGLSQIEEESFACDEFSELSLACDEWSLPHCIISESSDSSQAVRGDFFVGDLNPFQVFAAA